MWYQDYMCSTSKFIVISTISMFSHIGTTTKIWKIGYWSFFKFGWYVGFYTSSMDSTISTIFRRSYLFYGFWLDFMLIMFNGGHHIFSFFTFSCLDMLYTLVYATVYFLWQGSYNIKSLFRLPYTTPGLFLLGQPSFFNL